MAQTETRTLEIVARVRDFATSTFSRMGAAARTLGTVLTAPFRFLNSTLLNTRNLLGGFFGFLAARRAFGFLDSLTADLDELLETSQRLQVTTESLSAIRFVGEQAGVELETLATAASQLALRLDKGTEASNRQRDAFRELGLSVETLPLGAGGKIDLVELLARIAENMARIEDPTRRVALAMDIFGRGGTQLGSLLAQGSAGIREQAAEAQRLGLVFSEGALQRADAFRDSLQKLGLTARGVFQELFLLAAPKLTALLEATVNALVENRGGVIEFFQNIGRAVVDALDTILHGVAKFIDAIENTPLIGTGSLLNTSKIEAEMRGLREQLEQIQKLRESFRGPIAAGSPIEFFGARIGTPVELPGGSRAGQQPTEAEQALLASEPAIRRKLEELQQAMRSGLGQFLIQELDKAKRELGKAAAQAPAFTAPQVAGGGLPFGPPAPPEFFLPEGFGEGEFAGGRHPFEGIEPLIEKTAQFRAEIAKIGRERAFLNLQEQLLGVVESSEDVDLAFANINAQQQRLEFGEAFLEGQINAKQLATAVALVNEELEKTRQLISGNFWVGFKEGAREATRSILDLSRAGIDAANTLITGGFNRFLDAWSAFATGAEKGSEAFKRFAQALLFDLHRIFAQLLLIRALGGLGSLFGFGGGGGAAAPVEPGGTLFAAKGGVVGGSIRQTVPLRMFAGGGISSGPTLAIFGEGKHKAEAFVPLPDGRSIPAVVTIPGLERFAAVMHRVLAGGGGALGRMGGAGVTIAPVLHFNIAAIDSRDVAERIKEHMPMIESHVVDAISHHHDIRAAVLSVR